MTFLAGSGGVLVYKSLAWRSGQLAWMITPLDLSYGSEVEVSQMHRNRLRSLSLDAIWCVAEWTDVESDSSVDRVWYYSLRRVFLHRVR